MKRITTTLIAVAFILMLSNADMISTKETMDMRKRSRARSKFKVHITRRSRTKNTHRSKPLQPLNGDSKDLGHDIDECESNESYLGDFFKGLYLGIFSSFTFDLQTLIGEKVADTVQDAVGQQCIHDMKTEYENIRTHYLDETYNVYEEMEEKEGKLSDGGITEMGFYDESLDDLRNRPKKTGNK